MSIIDPVLRAKDLASKLPINLFQSGVANISAAYWGSRPLNPDIAQCAMRWFTTWAKAGGKQTTAHLPSWASHARPPMHALGPSALHALHAHMCTNAPACTQTHGSVHEAP